MFGWKQGLGYALLGLVAIALVGLPRSTTQAAAPAGRFVYQADGTVRDSVTGLTWQQYESQSPTPWTNAQNDCESLDFAGSADWRLPTVGELAGLVDEQRQPAIDQTFRGDANSIVWTGTLAAGDSGFAWVVNFATGSVGAVERQTSSFPSSTDYRAYTRCVH